VTDGEKRVRDWVEATLSLGLKPWARITFFPKSEWKVWRIYFIAERIEEGVGLKCEPAVSLSNIAISTDTARRIIQITGLNIEQDGAFTELIEACLEAGI